MGALGHGVQRCQVQGKPQVRPLPEGVVCWERCRLASDLERGPTSVSLGLSEGVRAPIGRARRAG